MLLLTNCLYDFPLQIKPHGGIFFDKFDKNSTSVDVHYTLVANSLALYKLQLVNDLQFVSGNLSGLEIDIHRR